MRIWGYALAILSGFLLTLLPAGDAFAQSFLGDIFGFDDSEKDLTTIGENAVASVSQVPGLITGCSYLLALLFGVTAILKLKDHVENPNQTPLRIALTRFVIGGGLLALPIIYEAMTTAISGSEGVGGFAPGVFTLGGAWSGIIGTYSDILGGVGISSTFNTVLSAIISSIEGLPHVITALGYLLGLLFGVMGLLKLKDHIENPEQTRLKEGIVRLLIGGALFAMPNVFEAMQSTIIGDADGYDLGSVGGALSMLGDLADLFDDAAVCNPIGGAAAEFLAGEQTVGAMLCNITFHTGAMSAFLTALSYLFGLVMGFWAILKVQDHALNPQQTTIWEGVSRFIAAGCFFTLPAVADVMKSTVAPDSVVGGVFDVMSIVNSSIDMLDDALDFLGGLFGGGGGSGAGSTCQGLDGAMSCFMNDISGPFTVVMNLFATIGGTILVMIGISRLIKSSQEGARAPGGIGTIMTFLTGGILLSYNEILGSFTTSLFGGNGGMSYPTLAYSEGMGESEIAHARTVIMAVLQFMTIVGVISFVRGIFIVRGVAEGNSQASLMAAVTHLVGGALAVNLGPLMNAVQSTLGISGYGIGFASGPSGS